MRIACPVCAATYDVPDQMLQSARKVRCGRCGEQWMAAAAGTVARGASAGAGSLPATPAPDETVAAPRVTASPPPPTPAETAVSVARRTVDADQAAAVARHPLLAAVGAEPVPRTSAPIATSQTRTVAHDPPPPSVWDRLGDSSAQPKPLLVSEPLEPGRGSAASYAELPEPRRAGAAVWLGWILSIVVWGLVAWAAYAYRYPLMDAWPPIRRLYSAFGLGPGS